MAVDERAGVVRLADDDVVLRRRRRGSRAGRSTRSRSPSIAVDDRRRRLRRGRRRAPGTRAGSLPGWSQISVSIGPGSTSFTSTPVPCRSTAIVSVQPHIANLLAQYAASFEIGTRPPRLDTFTTQPAPRASQSGRSARLMRTGAWKFTSITSATSSGVSRVTGTAPGWRRCSPGSRRGRARRGLSTSASAASRSPRSTGQARDRACARRHSASTSSSRSARRATSPTVAPRSASIGPSAAPIPEDAPVTMMFDPSICIG